MNSAEACSPGGHSPSPVGQASFAPPPKRTANGGLLWGGCGIVSFSLTLPITQIALRDFSPVFVTFGRAAGAAVAAALFLALVRAPIPDRSDFRSIVLVALGVVVGFPFFMSLALMTIPSSHGGVVVGIIPVMTAIGAVILGERPSAGFWMAATLGLLSVAAFCFWNSSGGISPGHLLFIAAAAAAALGYSVGANLACRMPASHVICWALLLAMPLTVPATLVSALPITEVSPISWLAMSYLTLVSMFLGFFAWYQGLAQGGIARVGQIQLAQPLLTIGWAWLLVNEPIEPATMIAGCAVIFSIWLTSRPRVSTAVPKPVRITA